VTAPATDGIVAPGGGSNAASVPSATSVETRSALPSLAGPPLAASPDRSSNQSAPGPTAAHAVAANVEPATGARATAENQPAPVAKPSAMDPITPAAASGAGGASLDSTDDRFAPPALSSAATDGTPRTNRLGIGLQVGGGVAGFFNEQMRQVAVMGGYWDARLAVGLKQLFALEVAYVGEAHPLSAAGVGGGAALVGNGAEGDLRFNIPIVRRRAFVTPYALAGLGWMHYQVTGASNDGTTLATADDMAVVPVGAGLTIGSGQFYVDTRFVYRFTAFENLVRDGSASQLGQSTLGASIGYLF
jgi:hypothetical protein